MCDSLFSAGMGRGVGIPVQNLINVHCPFNHRGIMEIELGLRFSDGPQAVFMQILYILMDRMSKSIREEAHVSSVQFVDVMIPGWSVQTALIATFSSKLPSRVQWSTPYLPPSYSVRCSSYGTSSVLCILNVGDIRLGAIAPLLPSLPGSASASSSSLLRILLSRLTSLMLVLHTRQRCDKHWTLSLGRVVVTTP